jgi:hypothetical protein
MSDETKAPGEGEAGGLPPDIRAHKVRMEDPAWGARLVELEAEVHRALVALFAHAGDVAAVSIPVQLETGSTRAVVAGDPIALFAALQGEGPRLLLNKHMIVGLMSRPKDFPMGALMDMLKGVTQQGPDDEDGDEDAQPTAGCECPRCERLRARLNRH